MEATNTSKLYAKLRNVYEDVDYIQKDKQNEFHKYWYASEAAIKDHLHAAFVKHGLVMLPPEVQSVEDTKKVSDRGKEEIITTAKIRFGIADVETGESVYGVLFGRGVDASDKGIYKAVTGALKYFLTTTFLIPTGDDPEDDEPRGKQTTQQAKSTAPPVSALKPQAASAPPKTTVNGRPVMPDTSKSGQQQKSLREQIADMQVVIGDTQWKRIMGAEGFEKAMEINSPEAARRILDLMKMESAKHGVSAKDLVTA